MASAVPMDWRPVAIAIIRSDSAGFHVPSDVLMKMFDADDEIAADFPDYLRGRSLSLDARRRAIAALREIHTTKETTSHHG